MTSAEYPLFVDTWAPPKDFGGPELFKLHLDRLIDAELADAGRDVIARLNETINRADPMSRALVRLFADLDTYLADHDCREIGHPPLRCGTRAQLIERIGKAKAACSAPMPVPLGRGDG